MEIGGFITSGAEIVNHDNTLSGNGTVDSPLGLNETVLWNTTTTGIYSATLSEPYSGFERVRVKFACGEDIDRTIYNEFPGHCTQLNLIGQRADTGGIVFCCGDLRATDNFTKLTPTIDRYIVIPSNTTAISIGNIHLPLFEIVGINRKA